MVKNGAFTLIELLVVISIISLLSSIVISTLQSARDKATATAIRSEARQIINLAQQEFMRTGTFYTISTGPGWITSSEDCDNHFVQTNDAGLKATEICESIQSKLPTDGNDMLIHCNGSPGCPTGADRINNYAVQVKLHDDGGYSGEWFCVGSSGRVYEGGYGASNPGCYSNP